MADVKNTDATGKETNISQPGKPTSQGTVPSPDDTQVANVHWNKTQNWVIIEGKKYKLTFLSNV